MSQSKKSSRQESSKEPRVASTEHAPRTPNLLSATCLDQVLNHTGRMCILKAFCPRFAKLGRVGFCYGCPELLADPLDTCEGAVLPPSKITASAFARAEATKLRKVDRPIEKLSSSAPFRPRCAKVQVHLRNLFLTYESLEAASAKDVRNS